MPGIAFYVLLVRNTMRFLVAIRKIYQGRQFFPIKACQCRNRSTSPATDLVGTPNSFKHKGVHKQVWLCQTQCGVELWMEKWIMIRHVHHKNSLLIRVYFLEKGES